MWTHVRRSALLATCLLSLTTTGCIKKILLDGQIASTRKASQATNTMSDFEVAQRAASAGMAQFEGLHYLAPYNEDGLFLLLKGWAGLSFGFMEDEMMQAEDLYGPDSALAAYHRTRAAAAYTRAIFYGQKLLEMRNPGFVEAKEDAESMDAWLAGFEGEEDAEYLFWMGQAWMSRINLLKDRPEYVAELFVGVKMMQKSVELDPDYSYHSGKAILGAYHARSAMAKNELVDSKKYFDEALAATEGKALLIKVNYATRYLCATRDKENYVKTLNEVIEAGDTLPLQRLQNTLAKRRARRELAAWRMEACSFDIAPE